MNPALLIEIIQAILTAEPELAQAVSASITAYNTIKSGATPAAAVTAVSAAVQSAAVAAADVAGQANPTG